MEEMMPIPIKNTELQDLNSRPVTFIRRKKKISKKFVKRLICLLLLTAIVGLTYKNLDWINKIDVFQKNVNCVSNSVTSSLSENPTEITTVSKEKYAFVPSLPLENKFINESNHAIDTELFNYSLPKAEKIYSDFSSDAPVVLITHFSPREAYTTTNGYSEASAFLSDTENVSKIGEKICEVLNKNGINAIHLKDYGYFGDKINGKTLYEQAVNAALQENPSISYIFDISRALSINADMTMNKEVVNINGISYPTIFLTCGTNAADLSKSKEASLQLMKEISNSIGAKAPLLISKQIVSPYELSQTFNIPTLRIDVGAFSCSFKEACCSAELFSFLLAEYLR